MQPNDIRERCNQIEQNIRIASDATQEALLLPMELKDSIQQLDEKFGQLKAVLGAEDEQQMRRCIDDLEQIGDRAKEACEGADMVDDEVRNAVMQAHRGLSELKHRLH